MADEQKVKRNVYSSRVTTASIWEHKSEDRGVFFSGVADFGILGISNFMIFQRESQSSDKDTMPDYNICTSYREGGKLINIGSLWRKEKEDADGRTIRYLSGVMSAGIHGEYSVAVFSTDQKKKSSKSPERIMRISISRDRADNSEASSGSEISINEDDVPF